MNVNALMEKIWWCKWCPSLKCNDFMCRKLYKSWLRMNFYKLLCSGYWIMATFNHRILATLLFLPIVTEEKIFYLLQNIGCYFCGLTSCCCFQLLNGIDCLSGWYVCEICFSLSKGWFWCIVIIHVVISLNSSIALSQ